MLLEDALQIVSNRKAAIYSRLFLVEKVPGRWRLYKTVATECFCGAYQVQDGDCDFSSGFHREPIARFIYIGLATLLQIAAC